MSAGPWQVFAQPVHAIRRKDHHDYSCVIVAMALNYMPAQTEFDTPELICITYLDQYGKTLHMSEIELRPS